MKGRKRSVELYLLEKLLEEGAIHLTLIDPVDVPLKEAKEIVSAVESYGSAGIMVGGSTVFSQIELDEYVRSIKESTSLPIIIFPSNVTSVVPSADAIWFMSLLNSVEWYYLVGAQMQGAPLVKKYGLDVLPMGYIVFGGETAVAMVGRALALNPLNAEVASIYALAAEMMGMRYVYLEAGSGSSNPIPTSTIKAVREAIGVVLVIGGGIRRPEVAREVVMTGADVIVTGNAIKLGLDNVKEIIRSVRESASGLTESKSERIKRLIDVVTSLDGLARAQMNNRAR